MPRISAAARRRLDSADNIKRVMSPLVGHVPFSEFMEVLRNDREQAILDACQDDVLRNKRRTWAAMGEVRAYTAILSYYDEGLLARAAEVSPE